MKIYKYIKYNIYISSKKLKNSYGVTNLLKKIDIQGFEVFRVLVFNLFCYLFTVTNDKCKGGILYD